MTGPRSAERPKTILIVAAFAAIYLIWGSTYLAIRVAVQYMPPFLMAGARFLVAGSIMYALVRLFSRERPTLQNWKSAAIVGALLLLGGNGLVCWSEQTVPSGVASLLITTVPIWMVLLHWMRRDGRRPTWMEGAGVSLGFIGVVLLIGMGDLAPGEPLHKVGAMALVLASLSWSFGSLYSRTAPLPKSPFLATAMEMLCGGVLLSLAGLVRGEWGALHPAAIPATAIVSLIYLIVFGSLIAFTAYIWLLGVTAPARVATYAFVNPVVAVLLGCVFLGEPFTPRFILASIIIVAAVALVIGSRAKAYPAPPQDSSSRSARTVAAAAISSKGLVTESRGAGSGTFSFGEGRKFSINDIERLRSAAGRSYYEFLREPSMSAGLYHLPTGGVDLQKPHAEDEVYFILEGAGHFRAGDDVRPVQRGDVLFVAAGLPHRFEEIREALTILVFFAPAESNNAAARELETAECC